MKRLHVKSKWIGISVLIILLSGCSSKFGYNNIDWMLYWYVDDYIELDKQQKNLLDVEVDTWHRWHRETELAQYRDHLLDIQAKLNAGPLNQQQWRDEFDKGRLHWERFRDEVGPKLTSMAIHLTDEQIEGLFDALEKENVEDVKDRQEDTAQERLEDNKKRMQKQMKGWFGRLSKSQKALIDTHAEQFKSTFDLWMSYRRSMQAEAKRIMMSRHEDPEFAAHLLTLMQNPDSYRSQEYIELSNHNRDVTATMLSELNLTLSAKQMRRVNNEIEDLVDDIQDLIED